jgi:superfamily II DNA or RNA helicase
MHSLVLGNRLSYITPPLPADLADATEEAFSTMKDEDENSVWFGYDQKSSTIYTGLVPFLRKFLFSRGVSVNIIDNRERPTDVIPFKTNFTMREYQEEAVNRLVSVGRGMASMATGSGKTPCALEVIARLGVKSLVIVPTQVIWVQFIKTALKMYAQNLDDVPDLDGASFRDLTRMLREIPLKQSVGYIGQGEWEPGRITIAISAALNEKSARVRNFFDSVDLTWSDECFAPETTVMLADGSQRKIADLVNEKYDGDVVCVDKSARDYTTSKVVGWIKKKPSCGMVEVKIGRAENIRCTGNHLFLTPSGWRRADSLRRGDMVISAPLTQEAIQGGHKGVSVDRSINANISGVRYSVVRGVEKIEYDGYIYCLDVEGHHNFAANSAIVHNCHHAAADSWFDNLMRSNAYYRFGGSGTTYRTDGQDVKLFATTGPVIHTISATWLIENGWLAKPIIKMIRCAAPRIGNPKSWARYYRANVLYNLERTRATLSLIADSIQNNIRTLVLVAWDEHAQSLLARMSYATRRHVDYVKSNHGRTRIKQAIERFANGEVRVLIATPLLSEGYDLCSLDRLIRASAMKSPIRVTQETGRVLRIDGAPKKGVKTEVWDFYDVDHSSLSYHSKQRYETWASEEAFEISIIDDWSQTSFDDKLLQGAYLDIEGAVDCAGEEPSDRVTELWEAGTCRSDLTRERW